MNYYLIFTKKFTFRRGDLHEYKSNRSAILEGNILCYGEQVYLDD